MLKVKGAEKGFTIIELMIATSVLSVMLVMVTVMMINIGNLYYKGISQSRIQDNVRSITDEVSKHLELGDNFFMRTSGSQAAYCIGSTRYTFILYKQIGDNPGAPDYQSKHVLWRDTNPTPGSCPAALPNLAAATPSSGGTELMAPHSRLTEFTITGDSPYKVSISEAYGDNDLLCDNGVIGDCAKEPAPGSLVEKLAAGTIPAPAGDIRCRGDVGQEFCATANLSTTVVKRLP